MGKDLIDVLIVHVAISGGFSLGYRVRYDDCALRDYGRDKRKVQLIHLHRNLGEYALLRGLGIVEALSVPLHNLSLFPYLFQLLLSVLVCFHLRLPSDIIIIGAMSAPFSL